MISLHDSVLGALELPESIQTALAEYHADWRHSRLENSVLGELHHAHFWAPLATSLSIC
jgi:hypothetical protein